MDVGGNTRLLFLFCVLSLPLGSEPITSLNYHFNVQEGRFPTSLQRSKFFPIAIASANTINLRAHQHTQPTHPPGEEQMSLRGTNGNSTVNPHGLTRTQNAFFLRFFLLRFDLQEDEEGLMYGDAPCLDIL